MIRYLLFLNLFIYLSCFQVISESSEVASTRPNVVIFIADDVSATDFGCYGHPTVQTPVVDDLASKGLLFTNAYLTAPSCSPSRTSLITGRYPHNTGGPELHMKKNPHLKNLPQFPKILREAGYYTALAGKAHFNGDAKGSFDKRYPPGDDAGSKNWLPAFNERDKDKPFLMWFAAIDAHRPWDQELSVGPHGPKDAVVPPYMVDAETTRTDFAHYYNEITRFDRDIGRVIQELKAQKVYDNTILIVMSDNGRPFPRDKTWIHDGGIKTPLVIHWPGRLKAGQKSRSLISSIDIAPTILELVGLPIPGTVQGVSFLPTLKDPKAVVRDVVFAERNWHVYRHHDRLVRYGDFTYIKNSTPELIGFSESGSIYRRPENLGGETASSDLIAGYWNQTLTPAQSFIVNSPSPKELLFDISVDPHQVNNLATDPKHRETLETMRELLVKWMDETGDTVPHIEKMTPDRTNPKTGVSIQKRGRPTGGIFPGQTTEAWKINKPGPILVK